MQTQSALTQVFAKRFSINHRKENIIYTANRDNNNNNNNKNNNNNNNNNNNILLTCQVCLAEGKPSTNRGHLIDN